MITLTTLESVAKELTVWRDTRAKRGPIPTELRVKIGNLRSRYSDNHIVKTLKLNTAQLKSFCQNKPTLQQQAAPSIEFARIKAPPVPVGVSCEIKRSDGSTLQCMVPPSDLKAFMQAFLCSH